MMTTDYEYTVDTLQEEPKTQPASPRSETKENPHLKAAHQQIEEYERRINFQQYSVWDAQRDWEDRAFKQAMMHAAYAQAEAATRQAEVMETILDTFASFASEAKQWDIYQ